MFESETYLNAYKDKLNDFPADDALIDRGGNIIW
jgi:hypothetical protein